MGLVSAGMADHQLGWTATLVYALDAYEPEYAVVVANTAWDNLVGKWWFDEVYSPVVSLPRASLYRRQPDPDQPYSERIEIPYEGGLILRSISFEDRMLTAGGDLSARLHIDVEAHQPGAYRIEASLLDAQNFEQFARRVMNPFDGFYGTDIWQPGDALAVPLRLAVPDDLQEGVYRLRLAIHESEGGKPVGLGVRCTWGSPGYRARNSPYSESYYNFTGRRFTTS